jgi:hypothetical protein
MSKKVTIAPKPSKAQIEAFVDQGRTTTGVQPVEERMKRFTFDVPESLHKRVKLACVQKGVQMADELRRILEETFPEQKSA